LVLSYIVKFKTQPVSDHSGMWCHCLWSSLWFKRLSCRCFESGLSLMHCL